MVVKSVYWSIFARGGSSNHVKITFTLKTSIKTKIKTSLKSTIKNDPKFNLCLPFNCIAKGQ